MKNYFWAVTILAAFTCSAAAAAPYDFDGDGKSDFGIHRDVSAGVNTWQKEWWVLRSSDGGYNFTSFGHKVTGVETDFPFPRDFDGDGKTDVAVVRLLDPSGQAYYFILNSATNTVRIEAFGLSTDDFTVTGDYDGDGVSDLAIYRKGLGTGPSYFIVQGSATPNSANWVQFGNGNMIPVSGDFDGDGKLDFCVRDFLGKIYLKRSSDGGVEYINWGLNTDIVYAGDFDGDDKDDLCAIRNNGSNFEWYILERDGGGTGGSPIVWGAVPPGTFDVPLFSGDYDGDGKIDIAVYRVNVSGSSAYYVRKTSDGSLLLQNWGTGILGDSTLANR